MAAAAASSATANASPQPPHSPSHSCASTHVVHASASAPPLPSPNLAVSVCAASPRSDATMCSPAPTLLRSQRELQTTNGEAVASEERDPELRLSHNKQWSGRAVVERSLSPTPPPAVVRARADTPNVEALAAPLEEAICRLAAAAASAAAMQAQRAVDAATDAQSSAMKAAAHAVTVSEVNTGEALARASIVSECTADLVEIVRSHAGSLSTAFEVMRARVEEAKEVAAAAEACTAQAEAVAAAATTTASHNAARIETLTAQLTSATVHALVFEEASRREAIVANWSEEVTLLLSQTTRWAVSTAAVARAHASRVSQGHAQAVEVATAMARAHTDAAEAAARVAERRVEELESAHSELQAKFEVTQGRLAAVAPLGDSPAAATSKILNAVVQETTAAHAAATQQLHRRLAAAERSAARAHVAGQTHKLLFEELQQRSLIEEVMFEGMIDCGARYASATVEVDDAQHLRALSAATTRAESAEAELVTREDQFLRSTIAAALVILTTAEDSGRRTVERNEAFGRVAIAHRAVELALLRSAEGDATPSPISAATKGATLSVSLTARAGSREGGSGSSVEAGAGLGPWLSPSPVGRLEPSPMSAFHTLSGGSHAPHEAENLANMCDPRNLILDTSTALFEDVGVQAGGAIGVGVAASEVVGGPGGRGDASFVMYRQHPTNNVAAAGCAGPSVLRTHNSPVARAKGGPRVSSSAVRGPSREGYASTAASGRGRSAPRLHSDAMRPRGISAGTSVGRTAHAPSAVGSHTALLSGAVAQGGVDAGTFCYFGLEVSAGVVFNVGRGGSAPGPVPYGGLRVHASKGPAARAGVKVGDLITALDGRRVITTHDFEKVAADIAPRVPVRVCLERDGEAVCLSMEAAATDVAPGGFGTYTSHVRVRSASFGAVDKDALREAIRNGEEKVVERSPEPRVPPRGRSGGKGGGRQPLAETCANVATNASRKRNSSKPDTGGVRRQLPSSRSRITLKRQPMC